MIAMLHGTKNIPNILSLSRIGLSFSLFFVAQQPVFVFWIIVACGVTDALDGFLARRLHCESDLGARLDSLGDLLFFSALVFYVVRYQMDIIQTYMPGIYAIFIIKSLTLVVCTIKNRTTYSLHTYGNKLTGILVVMAICLILLTGKGHFTAVLVAVGVLSALEELLIMSLYEHPDVNIRSIFLARKRAS
ncbi:MAG: CDP-alcohol phosphatidyltransferase family protein [Sphaerochaeta sp.]|jgi:CDP-diacylglycerol--glycerol-3-phosphate 3-phosphatidyltransferase|nr:CDP-alcohol phosphatidyltransferase family protein [Sphaerochaeta sp.]